MVSVELFGMRIRFFFILGLMVFGFVSGADYVEGELLIKYKDDYNPSRTATFSTMSSGLQIKSNKIISQDLHHIKFNGRENAVEMAKKYSDMDYVEYAEPNYIYHTFAQPNDPNYSSQWHLPNVQSEEIWNLTTGGEEVVIAIIDTGVEWDHPDLEDSIWNNTDEDCDDSTDKDLNDYFGDCRGYDFVDISNEVDCSSLVEDCNDTDNDPSDGHGHGTHCAGISGASTNNSNGIAGMCWNCKIMPLRAGHNDTTGNGSLSTTAIISSINYAIDNNATIISMSFGGGASASIKTAIDDAENAGIILVAAAGNDNSAILTYPAAYDNVIAVGATSDGDIRSSFSSYGTWVNIAAPGYNILSTYIDDSYVYMSGTSMSAPLVAGAIGLIKSLFPSASQTEIIDAFNETGTHVDFITSNISRINVYSALLSFDTDVPNVTLVSPADEHVSVSVNQSFACNVSDWQLANLTFEIWNSSGVLINSSSVNVSGVENSSVFNLTGMSEGTYDWNCLGVDLLGNEAYSVNNFSLTIGGISTILLSPSIENYTAVNDTNFSCSVASDASHMLTNITFYLWNSTGNLTYNLTNDISGFNNTSVFNYSFSVEDNYSWNCLGVNNVSNSSWGDNNFSVTYDYVVPVINITSSPTSETSNSVLKSFGFNVSDENIANCSLVVNDVFVLTNSSVNVSVGQLFSRIFTPGTYVWNINCSDLAGNVNASGNSSFVISAVVVASSGGGGGSSPKIFVATTEEVFSDGGYSQSLKKKEKINFKANSGSHSLSVLDVGSNYASILIESNPIELNLSVGQEEKLNLSSGDYYDFYVRLNSVSRGLANVTVKRIFEMMDSEDADESIDLMDNENLNENVSPTDEFDIGKYYLWIFVGVVIFVVIGKQCCEPVKKRKKLKKRKTRRRRGKQNKKVKAKAKRKR